MIYILPVNFVLECNRTEGLRLLSECVQNDVVSIWNKNEVKFEDYKIVGKCSDQYAWEIEGPISRYFSRAILPK